MKLAVSFVAVVLLVSQLAWAGDETLILTVDKPVDPEVLRSLGLLYLADLGDAYLAEADGLTPGRLLSAGLSFSKVTTTSPGDRLFLLTPETFADEILYSEVLFKVGRDRYLAKLRAQEIDDPKFLESSKVMLSPRPFTIRGRTPVMEARGFGVPDPCVASIVASVSSDTLLEHIRDLSGKRPVVIGGVIDTLLTRYTFSWRCDHAAQYILERFEDYGLDASFHHYFVGNCDFLAADFCDDQHGWVVGTGQRILRTRDGGETWSRWDRAVFEEFCGVCFLDTLNGWVSGTDGDIYHSSDGGHTWIQQSTPTSLRLRDISFLDSLNGWVVGNSGAILRTTDGGGTWTSVSSGTGNMLCGLHFQSHSRGWACGGGGTVLYWDGTSWSAQTSSTGASLQDVQFVDDYTGWIVGSDGTILKTVDGGANWTAQSLPAETAPYTTLAGVCFADTAEGWAVGNAGTIVHTDNGGASWESQDSGTPSPLARVTFVSSLEGWAVGSESAVLHTSDGGASWESQKSNLPAEEVRHLKNVVGTKPGTVSDQQIVICGHFDSISEVPYYRAPGADDNASGTASVIEAARVTAGRSFDNTMKFVCFSGEEQGLLGSAQYAYDAARAGDSIVAVFNLDMIGYVDIAPEDIDVIGDPESEWLADFAIDCATTYVPGLPYIKIIDGTVWSSDHASFWDAGFNALLGTEDRNKTYPYYHTTQDTPGKLTMSFLTDVVKVATATLAELAQPDATSAVAIQGEIRSAASVSPNPFSTKTTVSLSLGARTDVGVDVFDVSGRFVRSLHRGVLSSGSHRLSWDAEDSWGRRVSPGIYFIRVRATGAEAVQKVIMLR